MKICPSCLEDGNQPTAPNASALQSIWSTSPQPPPQACLELACASTCLPSHTEVWRLPLHHSTSCSVLGSHWDPLWPSFAANHLLSGKVLFPACHVSLTWKGPSPSAGRPLCSLPGSTGRRQQPDSSLLPCQRCRHASGPTYHLSFISPHALLSVMFLAKVTMAGNTALRVSY